MGTQDDCRENRGGARRDRTADLLHAMQALSQLSYSPTEHETVRARAEAVKNLRPPLIYRVIKPLTAARAHTDKSG